MLTWAGHYRLVTAAHTFAHALQAETPGYVLLCDVTASSLHTNTSCLEGWLCTAVRCHGFILTHQYIMHSSRK